MVLLLLLPLLLLCLLSSRICRVAISRSQYMMYRCYILWCINSIIPDIVINFQHKKFLSVPYYKIFSALLHFHVCIDSLAPMDVSHLVNTIMVPFHTRLFTEGRLVLTAQLTCALLVPRPCSRFEYETHSFSLSLSFVGALKCQN